MFCLCVELNNNFLGLWQPFNGVSDKLGSLRGDQFLEGLEGLRGEGFRQGLDGLFGDREALL